MFFLSGEFGTSGKRLDEGLALFSRKGNNGTLGSSFLIEIKAVQNAMSERGYDERCYADKDKSGKQSVT